MPMHSPESGLDRSAASNDNYERAGRGGGLPLDSWLLFLPGLDLPATRAWTMISLT